MNVSEIVIIILSLILIEGLLSIDNALVLAVLVRKLKDKKMQKKALLYGIWGAFFFRFLMLCFIFYLMKMILIQILGGLYLLYIALHHFFDHAKNKNKPKEEIQTVEKPSAFAFWKVVIAVELTDIVFSIDSIIAAYGVAQHLEHEFTKKAVVFTGGILGIITMRMVAGVFIKIIDRFPAFYHTGYVLVAWVGVKLVLECMHKHYHFPVYIPIWLFWTIMGVVFFASFIIKTKKPSNDKSIEESEKELEELSKNEQ